MHSFWCGISISRLHLMGADVSCGRYCGVVRVGRSGAEGTEWVSETSMVCKVAAGVEGSLSVVATSGVVAGSMTSGMSYDGSGVSGSVVWNVRSSGGASTTVIGGGFGTRR